MNESTLSRDLALRIGLAARELPDIEPSRLINVLIDCVGLPLTAEKLANLKVKDLKVAAHGEFADLQQDLLKAALQRLKEEPTDTSELPLPTVQPYQEGDLPNSIRVACASNGGEQLDGHFGSCAQFLIYQVSKDEIRLIDVRSSTNLGEMTVTDDKNTARAKLINDCHILYVVSIGGPPAAKVVKESIHPIKVPQSGAAPIILTQLQTVLAGTPPPWLAKIMGIPTAQRIIAVEETA
jgi:nitrogen fixation protein NifX